MTALPMHASQLSLPGAARIAAAVWCGHDIARFRRNRLIIAVEQPSFRCALARIWFHFVERVSRNHIDEWLLMREHYQEETL
jgi:hypothetical protein